MRSCQPRFPSKRPYVRFDGNDYSVPSNLVGTTVSVHAYDNKIIVEQDGKLLAEHDRSWAKGQRCELPEHHAELKERKRFGQKGAALSAFTVAFPDIESILKSATLNGENIGNFVKGLSALRNTLGDEIISSALVKVLERGCCTFTDLQREIDVIQMARRTPPPILAPLTLPEHITQRFSEITSLEQYKIKKGS